MRRRDILIQACAGTAFLGLPYIASGQSAQYQRVRTSSKVKSPRKSHSLRRIADPTGRFDGKIEKFELRGGECSSRRDCTPRVNSRGRMKARTRSEKILTARLRHGDEGVFQYSVFLPNDFTLIPSIGTTIGQFLNAYKVGSDDDDSHPLASLDTNDGDPNVRLYFQMSEARGTELERVNEEQYEVGRLARDPELRNAWLDIQISFGLSTDSDGYVSVSLNRRRLGTFRGRTITRGGWVEARYGLYQNFINEFPGGHKAVPKQVAYYGNVGLFKKV